MTISEISFEQVATLLRPEEEAFSSVATTAEKVAEIPALRRALSFSSCVTPEPHGCTTPQSKKIARFTSVSPVRSPMKTPELLAKFGKVESPHASHNPDVFDTPNLNKEARKILKNFSIKTAHTFITGSPITSRSIQQKPDKKGRIFYKGRSISLHDKPNSSGKNKLIPNIGRNLIRVPGVMAQELVELHRKMPNRIPFKTFLIQECKRRKSSDPTQSLETTGLDFLQL